VHEENMHSASLLFATRPFTLFRSSSLLAEGRGLRHKSPSTCRLTKVTLGETNSKTCAESTVAGRLLLQPLTLWRPLLPYGYSYKASSARPG